jgi:hypothetical protein
MLSPNCNYYLKKLKNISLADIVGVEFKYTYGIGKGAAHGDTFFHTSTSSVEVRNFPRIKLYETLKTAEYLKFNKFSFSILDNPSNRENAAGFDNVICKKTEEFEFEIEFDRPDIHRVVSPVGKGALIGFAWMLLVICCSGLIFVLAPMLFSGRMWGQSLTGKFLLSLIIVLSLFLLSMSLYMFVDYWKYVLGVRREKNTFQVQSFLPKDYPTIRLTDQFFSYERYGETKKLAWKSVVALQNTWGRTVVHTEANEKLPIPTYELISVLSNDIIVSNIIECAGLNKKGRNFWAK